MDLFSVYLVRKEEGSALRILDECCNIDHEVDITQMISLLEKKIDLLLHFHDLFQRTIGLINDALQNKGGRDVTPMKMSVPLVRTEATVFTIMTDRIRGILDGVEAICQSARDERAEYQGQDLDHDLDHDLDQDLDQHQSGYAAVEYHHLEGDEVVEESLQLRAARSEEGLQKQDQDNENGGDTRTLENAATDLNQSSNFRPEGVAEQESGSRADAVRFSQPLVTGEAQSDSDSAQAESKAAISKLEASQRSILSLCTELCERSIAVHREEYASELVEPYTLAIALMQRARVAERLLNGVGAMEFAEQAEGAAVRALGGGSKLAIGIMLEVSACSFRRWVLMVFVGCTSKSYAG
jgi:hypothetical protein